MDYTVKAEKIEDTGQGIIQELVAEVHGLTKKAAISRAERLAADTDNHVYISWFRSSDNQHGYLNRDGHGITGKRW